MFDYVNAHSSKFEEIVGFSWYYSTIVKEVLNNGDVRELLTSNDEHFDLIIVETLQTDALFGFADHFKAPIIGFSSYGTDPYIDALVDNISPAAYSPLHSGTSVEIMNFSQRLENMWHNLLMLYHRVFIHNPIHDQLYKEHFPNATKSLDELRQNFSIIFLNQHFSLSFPRPYVTNMIEVGGFHLQHKPQPLPQEMDEFISGSTNNVIYFSMGSNIKSEHFPAPIRKTILEAFSQIPYRVLWKFENPSLMVDKPTNVFISKWFPQSDILAHPKVKLFISHGGLLSLIEAQYYGKPILGIPIFFDQHMNTRRAVQYGFALSLDYGQLNATEFVDTIIELIENPKYTQKAKAMSERYRDQPIEPLEKSIYWTEYVLRHHGAPFLKSPAQHLNFFQKRCWDCAAVIGGGFLMAFIICILVIIKIYKFIFFLTKLMRKKEKDS